MNDHIAVVRTPRGKGRRLGKAYRRKYLKRQPTHRRLARWWREESA